jgi:CheY-like chemotaxis protein
MGVGDRRARGGVPCLRGLKMLVAEDQAMIALDLVTTLRGFGCVVLPAAPSNTKALAVIRAERPDAALLDVSLVDGSAAPVAEALTAAGVPFAVLTGHDQRAIGEPALRAAPFLSKPYAHEALRATVTRLAATVAASR